MKIKYTKKEKILIIFYLFMILFLGFGITFSYFLLADAAEKDSTRVYAGRLDVNYIQGDTINTERLYPIPTADFYTTKNIYRNKFYVSSDGTLEQTVQIGFNVIKNQFSDDMIKYKLYTENGEEVSTGYINQGFTVLVDNLYFEPVESRAYILLLWLEEKPFDQTQEMENKLSGRIIINSKQYGY